MGDVQKKKERSNLSEFERTYLQIIQNKASQVIEDNYPELVISSPVFIEDIEEEKDDHLKEENQLTPEEIKEIEAGKPTEILQPDGTTVIFNDTNLKQKFYYSDEEIIAAINRCNGSKYLMERDLGICRRKLNYYLNRRSEKVRDEYNRVIKKAGKYFLKRPSDDVIAQEIINCKGYMSGVASKLGVEIQTLRTWINNSDFLTRKVHEVKLAKKDFLENQLDKLSTGILVKGFDNFSRPVVFEKGPDLGAIKFSLKAEDKEKYGDSMEINKNIRVEPITIKYIVPNNPNQVPAIEESTEKDT